MTYVYQKITSQKITFFSHGVIKLLMDVEIICCTHNYHLHHNIYSMVDNTEWSLMLNCGDIKCFK